MAKMFFQAFLRNPPTRRTHEKLFSLCTENCVLYFPLMTEILLWINYACKPLYDHISSRHIYTPFNKYIGYLISDHKLWVISNQGPGSSQVTMEDNVVTSFGTKPAL